MDDFIGWFFAFFYQVNLTGSGLLNRTGAEIGYSFDKKCKKNIFLLLKKFKNAESGPALLEKNFEKRLLRILTLSQSGLSNITSSPADFFFF